MASSLTDFAKQHDIEYFLISYSDLFGVVRSKLVPAVAIADMQQDGAGFAGFASWLDLSPADADMFGMPDASGVQILPWQRNVAWVPADVILGAERLMHAPRVVLREVLNQTKDAGFDAMTGVECEFFLLDTEGTELADGRDIAAKPCYDQQALMRRFEVIKEICDYMLEMGWEPYQNDHEDANGQFEMNWGFTDPMVTADRHTFFKFMTKTVAEKHGFRATFMPKPMPHLTGNGAHVHLSLWQDGVNAMKDPAGELGLSQTAYQCVAGLLKNAAALTAITNPLVNSYKRINSAPTNSGASWSPNTITYGGNNRTHMIRIPGDNRIEVRNADGAANPYLLQAGLLSSALYGIRHELTPPKRLDIDMYTEGHKLKNVQKLPLNMLDAIRLLEKSSPLKEALGAEFVAAYTKLKYREWDSYMAHFSEWERANGLDV